MANIESTLDTFGFIRRPVARKPISFIVISEPYNDALPWCDALLPCGVRDSFALGVGGTELGRWTKSVVDDDGKLNAFRFDVLWKIAYKDKKKVENKWQNWKRIFCMYMKNNLHNSLEWANGRETNRRENTMKRQTQNDIY